MDNATCTLSGFHTGVHSPHMERDPLQINHILFEVGLPLCEGGGHHGGHLNVYVASPGVNLFWNFVPF